MEADFEEKDTHYETRKREIIGRRQHTISLLLLPGNLLSLNNVALKSKRSGLEDHVKEIDRELEKIHVPQVSTCSS
jgi:hypothetical protein